MSKKDLQEKVTVGGGATGVSSVSEPTGGTATLPNSKKQGDGSAEKPAGEIQTTSTENNTAPTGDTSASNKASVAMKGGVKEHVDAMFNGEELSEEFREKATVIFEAAISAQVEEHIQQLEEDYNQKLESAVEQVYEELTGKVDTYLDYVVEQWMKENRVAIETSLKTEITESFIDGMKNLFAEHYIDVPEEKFEVIEDLATRVSELEEKLSEAVSENVELKSQISEVTKEQVIAAVSEGLAATQVEKFKTLAEGVVFDDAESFQQKLEIVKENYFPSDKKKVGSSLDKEEVVSLSEEFDGKKPAGPVSSYVQAISRTIKR